MKQLDLTKERLLAMSTQQGDCLIWLHSKRGHRYGNIKHLGKQFAAHRVSYELHCGPIPPGMVVMHSCDNPLCINPAHLSLGTQAENVQDMHAKDRAVYLRGEQHPKSKLTAEQVAEIKRRYVPGKYRHGAGALAKEFGVSKPAVQAILSGETWKDAA